MPRKPQDQDNSELEQILQMLLDTDINITAREVARHHSKLSCASTITRHPGRRQLVELYKTKQQDMREWQKRLRKRSKGKTAELVTTQEAKIAQLDRSVRVLVAGHLSLIAAVGQVGGMGKLAKFYERFREIRDQLSALEAIPALDPQKPENKIRP